MVIKENLSSRYKRVIAAVRFPHKCVCGQAFADWYIDLNIEECPHGRIASNVYLCSGCINQIALENDYVEYKEVASRIEHISYLCDNITDLEKENNELRTALGLVNRLSVATVAPTAISDEPEPEQDSDENNRETASGKSEANESVNEQGSTDISSDDSDDPLAGFIDQI